MPEELNLTERGKKDAEQEFIVVIPRNEAIS